MERYCFDCNGITHWRCCPTPEYPTYGYCLDCYARMRATSDEDFTPDREAEDDVCGGW